MFSLDNQGNLLFKFRPALPIPWQKPVLAAPRSANPRMSSESHPESESHGKVIRRARRNAPREAGNDAIVVRARELLEDPGYPSDEIVDDLADIMARYGVFPPKGEPDA